MGKEGCLGKMPIENRNRLKELSKEGAALRKAGGREKAEGVGSGAHVIYRPFYLEIERRHLR